MNGLTSLGHNVNLQAIDNKFSTEHKHIIEEYWKITYQLVPQDLHWRNAAKLFISSFKDHLLSILAGINENFPKYLWGLPLEQANLTLNILLYSTPKPCISAWAYFNIPFD